jgi:uncharacterized membrane protein YbhN (UPF0104 family)
MFKFILKIVISFVILGVLFHEVQWTSLKDYFASLQWQYFFLALAVQFVGATMAAVRWAILMPPLGFKAPLSFYVRTYFKGVMFNQVLPSSIGGDAYRMLAVNQLQKGTKQSVLAILVDRIYGFIGLMFVVLMSLPWAYHLLPLPVFKILSLCIAVMFLGTFSLLALNLPIFLFLKKIIGFGFILELAQAFLKTLQDLKNLPLKLVLSVLLHLLTVYSFYILTKGMPISASFVGYLVIIPTILLFTMLPLSFAGWGIREGAMVYFGAMIGLLKPEALAISLLFGFILILTGLPGLYFYLFKSEPIILKDETSQ